MFSDLKPYPDYRESGSRTLGLVPSGWTVRPMRTLLTARTGRNRPDLPLLSVARERGAFVRGADDDNHNVIPEDLTGYKIALAGDLVINKMKAWQGSLGLAPCDGIVSPAYYVFEFAMSNRYFGQALLRSRPYVGEFAAASDGVRIGQWDLSVSRLRQVPVVVPPSDEQAAIVKYLAHANARIDRAIASKRNLITLLEEQKQAVINQAVTRGLDPTVSLKDSGIPWLGLVPAHWQAIALRRAWEVIDCKHLTVPYFDDGYPLASVVQAQRFFLDLSDARRTGLDHYSSLIEGARRPQKGDLVYCRNVGVGSAAVVTGDETFAMGQDVCLLRSAVQDSIFMNHFLRSRPMSIQLDRLLVGSTFRRINISQIRALVILVPPLTEQHEIVRQIESATEGLDAVMRRSTREIKLLREFRTRLTADVVTGQIDIRDAAARLPGMDLADLVSGHGSDEDNLDADLAIRLELTDTERVHIDRGESRDGH